MFIYRTPASIAASDTSGDVTLLDAVSATGAGATATVFPLHKAFQVIISATATCELQASLDGTNWITLRSSTASEGYTVEAPWRRLRGNVTAYTSGTVTLLMAL
jgi:hypothetical protein